MSLFSSDREKRLWIGAVVVIMGIYTSLELAGSLSRALRERGLLDTWFAISFPLMVTAISWSGLKKQPERYEIWVAIGITAVYGMVLVRIFLHPEERTHLFEYGLVAT